MTACWAVTFADTCQRSVMAASSGTSPPFVFWLSNTTDSATLRVVSVATLSRETSKSAVLRIRRSSKNENLMPASYCSADSGAPIIA
jgi:hypothetical protein